MTAFISKLQNIAFKLKTLQQTIDESMLISKILFSLPEKYKHTVLQLVGDSVMLENSNYY